MKCQKTVPVTQIFHETDFSSNQFYSVWCTGCSIKRHCCYPFAQCRKAKRYLACLMSNDDSTFKKWQMLHKTRYCGVIICWFGRSLWYANLLASMGLEPEVIRSLWYAHLLASVGLDPEVIQVFCIWIISAHALRRLDNLWLLTAFHNSGVKCYYRLQSCQNLRQALGSGALAIIH